MRCLQKIIQSKNLPLILWICLWGALPSAEDSVKSWIFYRVSCKAMVLVLTHQRAASALWIHILLLQCELLPEPGTKISSEGKALFCYGRAEVQSCQEETSSSHCPYNNLSYPRTLRLGGVIPNFTHCVDVAVSDTLMLILSLASLCPDICGGEKGDCATQLFQSCLTECFP